MAEHLQAHAQAVQATQPLRAGARAVREQARQVTADDHARRLHMHNVRSQAPRRTDADDRLARGTQPLHSRSDTATPSQLVLRVTGEIDIATVPAMTEAMQSRLKAATPSSDLIVDLTAVTFIDARGLAALLEAAESARSGGVVFRVIGCPPCLQRLLEITDTRDGLNSP